MPPPTEPMNSQILTALKTQLQTINGSPDYFNASIPKITVLGQSPFEIDVFPTLTIMSGDEFALAQPLPVQSVSMPVVIAGYIQGYNDPDLKLRRLQHDIIKCIFKNTQLGGLAIDCVLEEMSTTEIEDAEPIYIAFVNFTIKYRFSRTDPTQTG